MSNVYRVIVPLTLSRNKLSILLARKLIPLTIIFPDFDFRDMSIDDIMSAPESMQLKMADFDAADAIVTRIKHLQKNDWLVIYQKPIENIYFARFDKYKYIRYRAHLYIKHFALVDHIFTINSQQLHPDLLAAIAKRKFLEPLPAGINAFISDFKAQIRRELKQTIKKKPAKLVNLQAKGLRITPGVGVKYRHTNGPVIIKTSGSPPAGGTSVKSLDQQSFTTSLYTGHSNNRLDKKELPEL